MGSSPTAPTQLPQPTATLNDLLADVEADVVSLAAHRALSPLPPQQRLTAATRIALRQRLPHRPGWLWTADAAPLLPTPSRPQASPAALGSIYAQLLRRHLTDDNRLISAAGSRQKTSGSYYTPPSLVTALLDEARADEAATLCDPACGTGHILVEAARRSAAPIAGRIYGADRDPLAATLCRYRLWALGGSGDALWRALQHQIRCGDALVGAPQGTVDPDGWCGAHFSVPPQPLHWSRALPEVFAHGGFDVIVGNPPWEKLKLHDREYFAVRAPAVARAKSAAARKRLIAALPEAAQASHARARQRSQELARFVKNSGLYPLSARGDLNTYPLFVELACRLMGPRGRASLIVKTGILSDYGMRGLFGHLAENNQLVSAFDFSNRAGLFPDVVANERFTLLTLRAPQREPEPFVVSVLSTAPSERRDPARVWELTPDDIATINPNTRTCPLFQAPADAQRVRGIYRRLGVLLPDERGRDQWGARYYRLLDMTNDSGLFWDRERLLAHGEPVQARPPGFSPVIEGKLFDLFDHRHGDFAGVAAERRFRVKAEPGHADDRRKADPTYAPLPRYWVPSEAARARLGRVLGRVPAGMLCFRDVCRTHTDKRTVRVAICPPDAAGNKAPVLLFPGQPPREHARRTALLAAVMGSLVFDYVARQKFAGGSLNRYILAQLPVPSPEALEPPWLPAGWVLDRVVSLSCTADVLAPLAAVLGRAPSRWDPAARRLARAELDAAMFRIYGLDLDETAAVLDTFPVLARAEQRVHGRYRTRRAVLSAYASLPVG